MNLISNIQGIIDEIDNDKKPLSLILLKCLRIANYLNDIDGIIWLEMEIGEYDIKTRLENILAKINRNITQANLSKEEFNKRYIIQGELFLQRRTVMNINMKKNNNKSEEKVCMLSVANIEKNIKIFEDTANRNVVPNNLHPIDAYFANREVQTAGTAIDIALLNYNKIIEAVRSFTYSYLIQLENKYKEGATMIKETSRPKNKNVFIIHGQNEAKWRELEKILKDDFELNPIILQEQANRGCCTIIDKFESYASDCSYAFAIFTPDDIVENNGNKYIQARPNVIFELGWFSSYLGRKNVCILLQDGQGIEMFSDFQGVLQKRFYNNVTEIYRDIKLELKEADMI